MKIILINFLVIMTFAFSCKDHMEGKYFITFNNHSTRSVMIIDGLKDSKMNYYPDTLLPSTEPFLIEVAPNDFGKIISSIKWTEVINNIPSDTLSIYVFDSDTIRFYDWSKIKSDYKVQKRYDLSLEDMQKSNWTITYP
jgi:hypothetical protein